MIDKKRLEAILKTPDVPMDMEDLIGKMDIEDMAQELSQLRTMIANHWKHSHEEGWERTVTYCGYCGRRQYGDEDRHAPDCLVVRYKKYAKVLDKKK